MSVLVANVVRRRFPNGGQGFEAFLKVMHPTSPVKNDKIEIEVTGLTTDLPFGKDEIRLNDDYAKLLIEKRAIVPLREYELVPWFNPDKLQNEIKELKPVDDDVKKFMAESLK